MYFTYLACEYPFGVEQKAEEKSELLPHLTNVLSKALRIYHNTFNLSDLTFEYVSFDKILRNHVFAVKTSRFGNELLKEPQIILYFAEVDQDV